MPYRKKRVVRRKTGGPASSTVKKMVIREINKTQETKEITHLHSIMGFGSITENTYYLVRPITQGPADNQRIGNQIFVRGFRYYLPIQNADTYNHVRIMFLMPHKSVNPSATTGNLIADIFGGTPYNMWSPVNTDKYRVLRDHFINLKVQPETGTSSVTIPDTRLIKGFVKINKKFQFEHDAATATTFPTSEIVAVAMSDSAIIPNPGAIGGWVRLYYKDA